MPFAMRGSQASAKPRKLLQGTEGVEIPLDTWIESLFLLERCKVSLRSGRKTKCLLQPESRRKVQDFHPANSSPSSLGYDIARKWTRKACAVTTTLQKPCQWKILHQLLSCVPILQWNCTFFSSILPLRNGWCLFVYTERKSNLFYKLKTLMKSLILFLIQYSALAIIKKV